VKRGPSKPPYCQSHQDDDPADNKDENEKELHIALRPYLLDYSKREFRKLFSILSTKIVLWTNMVVKETVVHADKLDDILASDINIANRVVCQIVRGNSPKLCGEAIDVIMERYGDCCSKINLNIDCPNERVSGKREFGAILMKNPDTAYTVLESMKRVMPNHFPFQFRSSVGSDRIGVDDWDNLEFVVAYIERLQPVCRRFVLRARKCVLNGLMTASQNRSVPPLNFHRVYEICCLFPDCEFWIIGGIWTLQHAKSIVDSNQRN
jgi:tRNA-dihydrouridine synthase A